MLELLLYLMGRNYLNFFNLLRRLDTTDQSYRSEEIEISSAHIPKHTHTHTTKIATSVKNSNSANKKS